MKELLVIKIGGNVIDDAQQLASFITVFSNLNQPKILIHGGGKLATELSTKLNITTQMVDGRRITDAETLKIAIMVYAGLVNKQIVAQLQALKVNALGLSGADGNIILAQKRAKGNIDFGYVGDVLQEGINDHFLNGLIEKNITPVISPITHDGSGQLLNTNADTIASQLAQSMSKNYHAKLIYCFEKLGLMENPEDEKSLISSIDEQDFINLKAKGIISGGMLPKLENCFEAIKKGVEEVYICKAQNLVDFGKEHFIGTKMTLSK